MEHSGATGDFEKRRLPYVGGGGTPLQAKLEGSEDLRRRSEAAGGLTRRKDGELNRSMQYLLLWGCQRTSNFPRTPLPSFEASDIVTVSSKRRCGPTSGGLPGVDNISTNTVD